MLVVFMFVLVFMLVLEVFGINGSILGSLDWICFLFVGCVELFKCKFVDYDYLMISEYNIFGL